MAIHRGVKILFYFALSCVKPSQAIASSGDALPKAVTSGEGAPEEADAQVSGEQAQQITLNQCVYYTYDKNGNRLKQENAPINSGGTWGSSRYLCFIWGT